MSTVVEWTKQWKQEGLEKGCEEGRKECLEEGPEFVANLILRQIERKFGPLNESDHKRVMEANESALMEWGERLVSAPSIEEIFKNWLIGPQIVFIV